MNELNFSHCDNSTRSCNRIALPGDHVIGDREGLVEGTSDISNT